MPNLDGTGPMGRGMGRRRGLTNQRPLSQQAGPGGHCVCPKCGYQVAHQTGKPCASLQCPKCQVNLVRQFDGQTQ